MRKVKVMSRPEAPEEGPPEMDRETDKRVRESSPTPGTTEVRSAGVGEGKAATESKKSAAESSDEAAQVEVSRPEEKRTPADAGGTGASGTGSRSGVRTRKRNRSIKESAKSVSLESIIAHQNHH